MQDPLFTNKLAFAALAAILLVVGLPQLTNALFGGGHHGGGELHLAYPIEFEAGGGAAAEAEAEEESFAQKLASAAASAGERRAGLCKSCHSFEKGGANGTGPNLWNVVGRPVGGVPDYGYSSALKAFGGEWTYERLDAYLANSQEYIPGTAMVQRIGKLQNRAEIIAYLRSLSDDPAPLPDVEAASLEADDARHAANEE
ncbi:MAG: cytochrome c family protein [Pseudomonadota bacterium]